MNRRWTRLCLLSVMGLMPVPALAGEALPAPRPAALPAALTVHLSKVDDLKALYGTVRSRDLTQARVRTPGTITSLAVDEGDLVKPGQVLAQVADPKIALQIKAVEARIVAAQSRVDTARADLERSRALLERGVASQARVDQAQTAYDVAENDLKAARADLSVSTTQITEGDVLAPAEGRVLKVPVTVGSVVLPGESIATIAANAFLLRLELPERQARFIKTGDPVRIAGRDEADAKEAKLKGRITQVYPEVQGGRVIADAEAHGLDTFFIGERILVWISAGERDAVLIPRSYLFSRFGLDFVRLEREDGGITEAVVQLGGGAETGASGEDMVEVLSGLKAGDQLVHP